MYRWRAEDGVTGITKAFLQKTRYLFLVDTCLKLLIDHNVFVDNDQYFKNIAFEVWEYQIGDYRFSKNGSKTKKEERYHLMK
jgi:hypothetical protein